MNAIETHSLKRSIGNRTAVGQLTLAMPAGTVFGILGPNGARKTTTVRMLSALISPTSGEAHILSYKLGTDNMTIPRSIRILTESSGLYGRLSARQNLLFFARLYNVIAKHAEAQTERYLRQLGLWERRNDKVGGFSNHASSNARRFSPAGHKYYPSGVKK